MKKSSIDTSQGVAIFVVNTGSSSVKYKRFLMRDPEDYEVTHEGQVTRVVTSGKSGESLAFLGEADDPRVIEGGLTHEESIAYILINSIKNAPIHIIGNRVVHGRDMSSSCIITPAVEDIIKGAETMAPIHNPYALRVIRAMRKIMPDTTQIATFDTSPYVDMPRENMICPIPYSYFKDHGIRRYGFHGTSHRYIADQVAQYFDRPLSELKLVTCHMGNGTSITVWLNGRAVNTSMSFTPTAGTIMGSRCGDIDPGIAIYFIEELGKTPEEVKNILNNESGLLGISGYSNDVQELQEAMAAGRDQHGMIEFALDLYAKSVRKYIIQYVYEELEGEVDSIIFTAGIGENAHDLRERRIIQRLPAHLKNMLEYPSKTIQNPAPIDRGCFMVVPTNEELMIARDAFHYETLPAAIYGKE